MDSLHVSQISSKVFIRAAVLVLLPTLGKKTSNLKQEIFTGRICYNLHHLLFFILLFWKYQVHFQLADTT